MLAHLELFALDSPWGLLRCAAGPRGVVALCLPGHEPAYFQALVDRRGAGLPQRRVAAADHPAGRALAAYVEGRDLGLAGEVDLSASTEFQRQVLGACRGIPPGRTESYGHLAHLVGRPRASRAVGQVMHTNPVPLFVPCHRVVGANGSLTGFGSGLDLKVSLLEHEGWRA